MKKIVINNCYGGFGLSDEAIKLLRNSGLEFEYDFDIPRDNPLLIQIIEKLGVKANNNFSDLQIVEIPDDVEWVIEEYDGNEWVSEKHRTWP